MSEFVPNSQELQEDWVANINLSDASLNFPKARKRLTP